MTSTDKTLKMIEEYAWFLWHNGNHNEATKWFKILHKFK